MPKRAVLTGLAVPIADGLDVQMFGAVNLAISRTGTLVYSPRATSGDVASGVPVWVEQGGREVPVARGWTVALHPAGGLALSPDGRRLALGLSAGGPSDADIWIKDLPDGPLSRVTSQPGVDAEPFWSPDGRTIGFASLRNGPQSLWRASAYGDDAPVPLVSSPEPLGGASWSRDGRWLVYHRIRTTLSAILGSIEVKASGDSAAPRRLLFSNADLRWPTLSPDGRWLAYASAESGRYEAYVRPFPDVNAGK